LAAPNLTDLLREPTRHLFFTGKGGVGKTSLACSTAIALADSGRRVLLVSTDPASNLDEVLGVHLSAQPTPVPSVERLEALNIDPEEAARAYRECIVGPYRGKLPDAAVTSIEEQLSGACTVEIAAFDEFAKLLGSAEATGAFDHVIFDTAPTGHTLRLLSLPAAWTGYLQANPGAASCLGPLGGLQAQRSLYEATVRALTDGRATTLVLVTRPEPGALNEAERTRGELAALGIGNQRLVINGVFTATERDDRIALALDARGRGARVDAGGPESARRGHGSVVAAQPRRDPGAAEIPLRRRRPNNPVDHRGRRLLGAAEPDRRAGAARQGRDHDDGEGRRRQDDHRGDDRDGAGAARPSRPPDDDRSGCARCRGGRGEGSQSARQSDRPGRRNRRVHERGS
jgi:TRC40/GET3/ArsA family transport-energizing ATPase